MAERPSLTPEVFDQEFTGAAASAWLKRVLGDGLPDGVEPFSFVPADGLEEIAAALQGCRGQTIVDLACGQGGPGLWLARQVGADLIGIDFSPVGIEQAHERADRLGLSELVEYRVADAASTGLRDGCAAGLFCIDAIQFMRQSEVMAEVARVLEPGALAVFTTWESSDQVPDLAALFEGVGLEAVSVEERKEWADRQRGIYQQALADAPRHPDDRGLQELAVEARRVLPRLDDMRRVIGTARRGTRHRGLEPRVRRE